MVARLPGPRVVSFHHDDLGGLAWKSSGMLRGHAVPSCAARCPGWLAPGAQPVRGRSSHPIELDNVSQVANAVLWMNAVDLFHVKRHFRHLASRETSFPPSNHDDGGRRREQVNAAQYDMLVNTSEPADGVAMLVEFLRSAATLQCQQMSTRF